MTARGRFACFKWFFLIGLFSWVSEAARLAVVNQPDVPVFDEPNSVGKKVDTLSQGVEIVASNLPDGVYHKVRTPKKTIGFVEAKFLNLSPAPTTEALAEASLKYSLGLELSSQFPEGNYHVRLFGGATLANPQFLTASSASVAWKPFYGVGVEGVMFFGYRFGLVLRLEQLSSGLSFVDPISMNAYQVNVTSVTGWLGLEYLFSYGSWFFHFGCLGGLARSGMKSTITNAVAVNALNNASVSNQSIHPTVLGRLLVNWQIKPWGSIFLVTGYRYSISSLMAPTDGGASGLPGGVLQPTFVLDLSGPMLQGGLAWTF